MRSPESWLVFGPPISRPPVTWRIYPAACPHSATVAPLALHPERRTSGAAHDGLDHLLSRETRDQWSLGFEVSRLLGLEPARGMLTFYATFDLAFLLDLASRCGISADEERLSDLVQ